ncbi:hypothetical protein BCR33DRAFT_5251 [Rhizoclosmatium globosum]|uniref:Uncharacterized protein n=1 Tax=Rhizoclosmatium globosum TaxID=329046 RepID=A0A1Y2D358_9FUNG|nr:hypothetical protein BCR33DRAFT_5251 [Rhizoclosmatium globosum]|eukprot:ORY53647.1 hypothetical protein BCR33DRAFT_5251 [Rhizoclosmatium globosum]
MVAPSSFVCPTEPPSCCNCCYCCCDCFECCDDSACAVKVSSPSSPLFKVEPLRSRKSPRRSSLAPVLPVAALKTLLFLGLCVSSVAALPVGGGASTHSFDSSTIKLL